MGRSSSSVAILLLYLLMQSFKRGCKEWSGWARSGNGEEIEQAQGSPWPFRKGLSMQEQGVGRIGGEYLVGALLPENVVAWLEGIWHWEATCAFHVRLSFSFNQT